MKEFIWVLHFAKESGSRTFKAARNIAAQKKWETFLMSIDKCKQK